MRSSVAEVRSSVAGSPSGSVGMSISCPSGSTSTSPTEVPTTEVEVEVERFRFGEINPASRETILSSDMSLNQVLDATEEREDLGSNLLAELPVKVHGK